MGGGILVKQARVQIHVSSTVEQASNPQIQRSFSEGPAGGNERYFTSSYQLDT